MLIANVGCVETTNQEDVTTQHPIAEPDTLHLAIVGDLMGHGPQIRSAYNQQTKEYDFKPVFEYVAPSLQSADVAIGNLELTLAGKPFRGYPRFSAPDAYAVACKHAGFDVLVTANNHSCDRGKKGIERTITVLDSLALLHTGTFATEQEYVTNNLLQLDVNNFTIAILNYTYGTNGLPIPDGNRVNVIDRYTMLQDIEHAKQQSIDYLILILHWGNEYWKTASDEQIDLANWLTEHGVDAIIGSHPHVLQPMEWRKATDSTAESVVAYSLGNFVSNQRERYKNGGAIFHLYLKKQENTVTVLPSTSYELVWVKAPSVSNNYQYQVLPASVLGSATDSILSNNEKFRMEQFLTDSRMLFQQNNLNINEKTIEQE